MARLSRILAAAAIAALAMAQETTIRTTARLVLAPVTVTGRDGRYVDGLAAHDFLLYDNGRPQSIHLDVSYAPISLVIAVQTSEIAAPALAKIRKIGSMIEPLIIGERGEAAVVAYSGKVECVQDFTSEPDTLSRALKRIGSEGSRSRMIDAVAKSVSMLKTRPPANRRVLLVIGETRDRSSEGKLEDAVTAAQLENVTVYPLTYSAFFTAFTAKPADVPPPSGPVGLNIVAIMTEISRLAKTNAAEALARYTGGHHLSFLKQKSLEEAVSRIGEELHSQYLLSFSPPERGTADYHEIRVTVRNRPDVIVRTRPGYWFPEALHQAQPWERRNSRNTRPVRSRFSIEPPPSSTAHIS